jgi:alkylation response protein AidB-like acyl-CoA dehydrogenase
MRYGWPEEVGGLGGPAVLRAVLGEEVTTRGLTEPEVYSLVEVLAPTMISYARPSLAAEMVPLLLSGREQWCQGFSEPTGTSRAMLGLARSHVLDRRQFGRSLASFQAARHRLAETLADIEGAEAALLAADGDLGSLLAKAAAGQAALTAARHSQQVLGGIGFTAEHALHRHIKRVLVLDGLLGSTQELIRAAGAQLRKEGSAPRLVQL